MSVMASTKISFSHRNHRDSEYIYICLFLTIILMIVVESIRYDHTVQDLYVLIVFILRTHIWMVLLHRNCWKCNMDNNILLVNPMAWAAFKKKKKFGTVHTTIQLTIFTHHSYQDSIVWKVVSQVDRNTLALKFFKILLLVPPHPQNDLFNFPKIYLHIVVTEQHKNEKSKTNATMRISIQSFIIFVH